MVKCPKCASDQVTAQKKGFSGGKALAGALVAGPVGALVGTHGSSKIHIYCLACGHTWDPKTQAKSDQLDKEAMEIAWKHAVVKAYDSQNMVEAMRIYSENVPNAPDNFELSSVIDQLRKDSDMTGAKVLLVLIVVVFIFLLIWMLS